ncbi:MAG: transpeptidase family protein [Acidobacteria bacterium]|nr:transpeptidase family protein [Acidobacteriota bacterium]MCB9396567.1 transpeptidase family protein [Acidobacteriota bacterium]
MSAYQKFSKRWGLLLAGFSLWSCAVFYRLFDIQILHADSLRARSERLHRSEMQIPSKRGDILDRNGKILATSQVQPSVCADPSVVENPEETARQMAAVLGKDKKWIRQIRERLKDSERSFAYVERFVSPRQWEAIDALGLKGIFCQKEPTRHYPKEWIGSHVVGFVSPHSGMAEGAEQAFEQYVAGTPGSIQTLRDGRRQRIWLGPQVIKEPVMGSNVELTLDENIQFFSETAVRRAYGITKATNITAIVMDPQNGAILAMANAPDFNPNFFGRFDPFKRKNRAVVDVYEPASAFKIVTVASAIELGTIRWGQKFFCEEGGTTVYGKYIKDNKSFGTLTVEEILWHSSNVGSIKIAQTMSPRQFHDSIEKFGFGERTGIELPAEAKGIFRPLDQWTLVSPAYLSIGHELSSTPLQMLRAASVVANGGFLVKPHIGKRVLLADGGEIDLRPQEPPVRVISEKTAQGMVEALKGVVSRGTAKHAQIPGVEVFGKTGTAQRLVGSSYSHQKFNASFVGFFPAEAPRYGIIVVVHDPKMGKVHGGEVAAPIFSEIGRQIVLYEDELPGYQRRRLQVSPDSRPNWPSAPLSVQVPPGTMPDLKGLGLRNALNRCSVQGIGLDIEGSGIVIAQEPEAGSPIPAGGRCKVRLGAG